MRKNLAHYWMMTDLAKDSTGRRKDEEENWHGMVYQEIYAMIIKTYKNMCAQTFFGNINYYN
jgi:hypothetical protein